MHTKRQAVHEYVHKVWEHIYDHADSSLRHFSMLYINVVKHNHRNTKYELRQTQRQTDGRTDKAHTKENS